MVKQVAKDSLSFGVLSIVWLCFERFVKLIVAHVVLRKSVFDSVSFGVSDLRHIEYHFSNICYKMRFLNFVL